MERINDLVGYKNLKIVQNNDWFKFSLESVLLPCFVIINKNTNNILDLCTGNVPIPLVLSTKTKAKIYGVEIQKDVYDLAKKSVDINNLSKQIEIINDDVKNISNKFESDTFDIITCNPPYFKDVDTSKKNDDIHKIIARHEVSLNMDDISKVVRKLLKNDGKFYLVHRTERFLELTNLLMSYNIMPKRVRFIYPKEDSESNLFMLEAVKNGKVGLKLESPLYVHNNDGSYKDEILKMFNEG
jgi:tRNA1(Val) A37 N6-methylase TrmN6